ncbi:putative transcription initiation factor TFIID, 31kD subunit [Aspergillus saccharolyticus JOP 1030-1]|uniref:TFIID-31kDa-domain-containing protein n=1 Tax=Aspergillus saccharolyticus JOP 1030-1 TaxID=1450539 RepID=A0A318ZDR0_9EURO|nr:TFIID-31kDa-domain-containing protein [Aspergillus saccharolyticus JOP 1030-1]PYH45651.1 TFIID-31kDa-domain-containing protein [Aspergillus saccharolyticus JOP 1030-1]
MASPTHPSNTGPTSSANHPITPPADHQSQPAAPPPPTSNMNPTTTTTTTTNNTTTTNPTSSASTTTAANNPNTTGPSHPNQPTQIPSTSLKDTGKSRRPRDVRLIHMLLASLGVTAYQERVPLQLLDFAYRYTSSVLQDAVHLATEGYAGATTDGGAAARGPPEVNSVSLPALRLSIASRLHYQFQSGLPKEFLMDVAAERNRVALPGASRGFDQQGNSKVVAGSQGSVLMGGLRLPPERFCLTGNGWNLKEEWESEGEEEEAEEEGRRENGVVGVKKEEDEEEEEDEDGKMEDVFGEDTAMGEGDDDGDKDMTDV